jgi:CubicO group peptidase (beta-lactamase class C family)
MRKIIFCIITVIILSGCAGAFRRTPAVMSMSAVTITGDAAVIPIEAREALADAVRHGAAGVTAIVMRDGKQLFRLDIGKIDADAQYQVASASKWMTAALVMTVVDEGRLSLDEPISQHLPEFRGEAARTTLRQLLAQTAGEGSLKGLVDIKQDPRITLAESAKEVAERPLEDPPGTVFKYGGPGFQVAGALVEAVTGKRWADLFKERISGPLGMSRTYWEHLPNRGVPPEQTLNPLLQGGVVTTAKDYMRFLTLLAQGGEYEGRRILSARAIDTMETVQTLGKTKSYLPPGARKGANLQYALGNWCESWSADGRCTLVSSSGAFGTYPWIDRTSGLYGIFFTRTRMPFVIEDFIRARALILAAEKKGAFSGKAER